MGVTPYTVKHATLCRGSLPLGKKPSLICIAYVVTQDCRGQGGGGAGGGGRQGIYLLTHLTMMVPTAMLCAASSIHHSPLSHREVPEATFCPTSSVKSGWATGNSPTQPSTALQLSSLILIHQLRICKSDPIQAACKAAVTCLQTAVYAGQVISPPPCWPIAGGPTRACCGNSVRTSTGVICQLSNGRREHSGPVVRVLPAPPAG